jgi:pyruvate dehydrogenase E2 component (dihydrolipoamide acetyltransferase)
VAIEVIMPKLGMTMEEGTIVSWLRQEGEQLAEGEPLFEVETDKVTMEVPAPASGVLRKVLAKPGSTLTVGQTIAIISQPGEAIEDLPGPPTTSAQSLATAEPKQVSRLSVAEAEMTSDLPVKASPAAKKLAREHRIDLRNLKGSGPGGRIIESDVMQAISSLTSSTSVPQADAGGIPRNDKVHQTRSATEETVALSGIRKRTAERMAESFQTIPHFYLTMEVLADRLVTLREALLGPVQEQGGVRLSYTDLLVKGLAWALRQHPEVNSAWEEGGIRRNRDVNIGIAVATRDGLVVPVIHHADTLTIAAIARQRKALVEAGQSRKLSLDLLVGGTFTLTNLGAYGVDTFAPIINPPQAAILAAGRLTERAVAVGGKLALRPTVFLTLAADHRILDGHEAATFLSDIRKWVESAELDRLDFPKDPE